MVLPVGCVEDHHRRHHAVASATDRPGPFVAAAQIHSWNGDGQQSPVGAERDVVRELAIRDTDRAQDGVGFRIDDVDVPTKTIRATIPVQPVW